MGGASYFFKGLRLATLPGIRPFVLMPVLLNLLLFIGLTAFLAGQVEALSQWLESRLGDWVNWLLWLVWLLLAAVWLVAYGYLFTAVSTLIGAPFYGLLAEKVQRHLRDDPLEEPLTVKAVLKIAGRSFRREWQKWCYLLPRLLGVLLAALVLTFVPVVNLAVPVLLFLWGAWSLALENADYAADNKGVAFADFRAALARRRITALGFGGTALFAAGIPVFNLVAVPAAVAGGTALWVERLSRD